MTPQRLSTSDSSVLDFLRATAVCLVLLDHVVEIGRVMALRWFAQRAGWIGVMLFFVHTCLVLMFSLERTRATGTSLLTHFYLRRAFRIYPLAIVVIALVVAFQIPVASIRWTVEPFSVPVVAANLALAQNLFYIPSVLGPLWSLPIEIQMYVLLPFLFWIVGRGTRLQSAVVLAALFVGLALIQHYITDRANALQFAPVFMGGIIAYCLTKHRSATWPFWTWVIALGTVVIGYAVIASVFRNDEPMAVSWILGLAVGTLVPHFRETKSDIIRRMSALVAKYSYGIYLTHMLAFWIAFVLVFPSNYAAGLLLGLALTVLTSVLAYHLVESPCIGFGARLAARFLDHTSLSARPAAAGRERLTAPLSS
jgi:peptidoglycan/LPS O-acetylase OafA/YrhL